MVWLVIDASVAVKWFFTEAADEPDAGLAADLLLAADAGRCRFVQPPHFAVELGAVLARRQPLLAERNLADLGRLSFVDLHADVQTLSRGVALAVKLNQRLFDTLYHATALNTASTLVTADRRYHAAARRLGGIELLSQFRLG